MLKSGLNYFVEPYARENMELQRKVKAVVVGSVIMIGVMLFTAFLSMFMEEKKLLILTASFILAVMFCLPLFLVRIQKFNYANLTMASFFIIGVAAVVFPYGYKTTIAMYAYCCMLYFGLFLIFLISHTKFQIMYYTILSVISLIAYFGYQNKIGVWKLDDKDLMFYLLSTSSMILMSGLIAMSTISMMLKRIDMSNKAASINKERYEKVENILISSKEGIDIGERLVTSTNSTVQKITEINQDLRHIGEEINALNSDINSASVANNKILDSTDVLNGSTMEYNATVTESSSAIEEMTASIRNISSITNAKKELINRLVTSAGMGEDKMKKAAEAINQISEQASNILEITDLIVNVADQTDLLAMNAAIEAAHAGDSGRGFAIVADEIRKLAEQTNSNIKMATDTLKKNISGIKAAAVMNNEAADIFHKISGEVTDVKNSMEEIIIGMQELSSGTSEIMNGVTNTVKMSQSVMDSTKNVEDMLTSSNNSIHNISNMSGDISQKIQKITDNFHNIVVEATAINKIGNENIEHIGTMNQALEKLSKNK